MAIWNAKKSHTYLIVQYIHMRSFVMDSSVGVDYGTLPGEASRFHDDGVGGCGKQLRRSVVRVTVQFNANEWIDVLE